MYSDQPAAQVCCLHNVVVGVLVRFSGCDRACRLQNEDKLVSDPEVLVLRFLDSLLPIAAGRALVVVINGHEAAHRLVSHQV